MATHVWVGNNHSELRQGASRWRPEASEGVSLHLVAEASGGLGASVSLNVALHKSRFGLLQSMMRRERAREGGREGERRREGERACQKEALSILMTLPLASEVSHGHTPPPPHLLLVTEDQP